MRLIRDDVRDDIAYDDLGRRYIRIPTAGPDARWFMGAGLGAIVHPPELHRPRDTCSANWKGA